MKYASLEHSSIKLLSHLPDGCEDVTRCPLHARSEHHMRKFRQFFSKDRGRMERRCTHNVGHPDPDDYNVFNGIDDGSHDCDACCIRFATEEEYNEVMKKGK